MTAADGVREAAFAAWWSGAWEALPADEDAAHEAFCAGWEAARAPKAPGSSMDIPQTAIDAALTAASEYGHRRISEHSARVLLEAAAPHLSGTCALHGDLDQAVILRALSDPGSFVGTRQRRSETIWHWQMRAVVASLTAPATATGGAE